MTRRPSLDDLKLARDGHLFWGKPDIHRVDRRCPSDWLIEYGDDGLAVRMWWNRPAVEAWRREQRGRMTAGSIPHRAGRR